MRLRLLDCPCSAAGCANVDDERMGPRRGNTTRSSPSAASRSGSTSRLVAELNLNDIKGEEAPSFGRLEYGGRPHGGHREASNTWLAVAANVPHTRRCVAKQAAKHRPHRRAADDSRSTSSPSWWKRRGHQVRRPLRTARRPLCPKPPSGSRSSTTCGRRTNYTFEGKFYRVHDTVLQPKPATKPAAGESIAGGRERGREET